MPDEEPHDDDSDLETDLDFDDELTEQADERVSLLILSAAVIGVLVGLFVWGSLAMSVMSSTEGLIDDFSTDSEGSTGLRQDVAVLDCDAFDPDGGLKTGSYVHFPRCLASACSSQAFSSPSRACRTASGLVEFGPM